MKISKFVQSGRLLAATTAAVVALPAFAASNGICGPTGCVLIADLMGDGADIELFFNTYPAAGTSSWTDDVESISRLGTSNAKPIVGDYNNDGFDDLAVYENGVFSISFNVNGNFEDNNYTHYSLPSAALWGPNTIPVTGNWDGVGGDDFGIYTNGMFRLFPDKNDLTNQISIDFGSLPQIPGYVFAQMPFSGPIDNNDQGIDLVGIYFGNHVEYAPANVDSTFAFGQIETTTAVTGFSPRPSLFARPHILEYSNFDPQFSYLMPPGVPALDRTVVCPEGGVNICTDLYPKRPDTEQPVVIVPDPFQ